MTESEQDQLLSAVRRLSIAAFNEDAITGPLPGEGKHAFAARLHTAQAETLTAVCALLAVFRRMDGVDP